MKKQIELKVCRLNHGLPLPQYHSDGASGLDLYATETVCVLPGRVVVMQCGIALEIPPGYEGQIRGRSSNTRGGLWTAFGTIDSDYRGEVGACLVNLLPYDRTIVEKGDRIAQLVIAEVPRVRVVEVVKLSETKRGKSGWGSTGRK